jgi:hypothetical protein
MWVSLADKRLGNGARKFLGMREAEADRPCQAFSGGSNRPLPIPTEASSGA